VLKSRIAIAAVRVLGSALMATEPASTAGGWFGRLARSVGHCRDAPYHRRLPTAVGSKRALIDDVVAPSALPSVDRLANECIESLFDILAREQISKPLAQDLFMATNPAVLEPFPARPQYARRFAMRDSGLPCAGDRRRPSTPAGDAGLKSAPSPSLIPN
jgi:hypothetical protein